MSRPVFLPSATLWLALSGCGTPPAGVEAVDPGRVVLQRLNRAEYDNTVRDLFGTSLRPAVDFPSDDFAVGFDNIGAALSVSALHVELYDKAADRLLDELFGHATALSLTLTVEVETGGRADHGNVWDAVAWVLWTEGSVEADFWLPSAGQYTLAFDGYGQQAGDDWVRAAFEVDGAPVAEVDVVAEGTPAHHTWTGALPAGLRRVGIAFLNDLKLPPDLDRNLIVDRIQVTGPIDLPLPPPAGAARVLSCDPALAGEGPCAEQIVRTFTRRAWRRPLSEAEVAERMVPYSTARGLGGSWEEGVRAALKSVLLSPWFLYKVQLDATDGPRPLGDHELATRLSYFLWSSTPDDRLLDLADQGLLSTPEVLEAEARRMLKDGRAVALVENLAGQWLGVRKVAEAAPSPELFPEWDEGLRASMRDELSWFVASILLEDRSALELLTSETTRVDPRLAEFYGAPAGEGVRDLTLPERRGLLGKAGLMAALAYPTRTSPVLRGKWVLDNLLCSAPPPPPAGVPALDDASTEPMSLREQLEQHRADPACAVCHDVMDAIGLGLEGFDAIGRYRVEDQDGLPIDATGTLPGAGGFDGAAELQALLVEDPRLPECMVEKTFVYALGRPVASDDAGVLTSLESGFSASDHRFTELAVAVVLSRPFRYRQGMAP